MKQGASDARRSTHSPLACRSNESPLGWTISPGNGNLPDGQRRETHRPVFVRLTDELNDGSTDGPSAALASTEMFNLLALLVTRRASAHPRKSFAPGLVVDG